MIIQFLYIVSGEIVFWLISSAKFWLIQLINMHFWCGKSQITILLSKLELLGVKSPLLGWLGDLLVGRSIKVVLHGNESHLVDACSGVPQCSVISPTLFLNFINYICHNINAKFVLFADDFKVISRYQKVC